MFPCVWRQLHVFPRLAPITRFLVLGIPHMFSRAKQRLYVFPCLARVTYFPAVSTEHMFFFRVLRDLHKCLTIKLLCLDCSQNKVLFFLFRWKFLGLKKYDVLTCTSSCELYHPMFSVLQRVFLVCLLQLD